MKKAQKPPQAGKPQKGKKEEAQKPASKGTMEKPLWEGKYTAIVGGRKYSRKAYQTAKSLGFALGEVTEGAFWGIAHAGETASGKAQAQKRFADTKTLEDAKEGRRELAGKQAQAQALLRASKLWGALEEARSERKEYIALTKAHEEELFIASKVAKGYDLHSAKALWAEKQAKKAQREREAQEKREREVQAQARKRDLEGWERIQKENAQREREAQKPASKPAQGGGGKAPSKKEAASRA